MKCDICFNSRPIVSENGVHYICTLSNKKATDCLYDKKDSFAKHPAIKEGQSNER